MANCERCAATNRWVKLVEGECPKCSWMPPKEGRRSSGKRKSDTPQLDPQCTMRQGLLRCALPATWYPQRDMEGWCWLHDDDHKRLSGPELHDQLQDIRDYRNRYIVEHEGVDVVQQRMADLIEAHPEWHRGEEEGAREYALRMLSITRPLGSQVRERQHVEVETQ